jgi:hypothetical protein
MRNDTGIFNSRNYVNDYVKDLRRAITTQPATPTTLEEKIAFLDCQIARLRKEGSHEVAERFDMERECLKAIQLAEELTPQVEQIKSVLNDVAQMRGDEFDLPFLNCERRLAQLDDLDIAIEALKELEINYPAELLFSTRAAFLAGIKQGHLAE